MRERLALLREYLKNRLAFGKNKKTRKGFILTMVALVEVLAISVVSVSAWVETISTITIKAEGAKIDNYVYTNADIGSGNGYSGKTIDLTKYFRAAGGVHLASASSADGENIFFPIKKSDVSDFGANSYRCADVNDKNVNYIDFSFNVKVDKTFNANHAEFYLDQVPKISIGGADVSGNLVRMAITDTDTQNTVVCGSEASNKNVVSKAEGNQTPETVRAFSDFVVNPESEPTELFRVDKGSSKTINIKVWLQDDKAATEYAGKTVSISDVKIVTQNKKGNKVYFVDRTVNKTTKNLTKNVTFQQGDKTPVTMKFNENSHTYSCNYTPAEENTVVKFTSEGGVTWTTDMKSLNSGDSMYYTAYGDHNSSDAGYGTWGEVIEISVSSKTDVLPDTGNVSSVYMVPDKNDSYSKVRMPFTNDKNKWVGYIAKEKADKMTFSFTNNGNTYKIPAPNRGNSTLFVVTSAKTGYWDPPATITVTAGTNGAGDPKVSYDSLTSATISVTPGTKVQLIANPNKGFVLKNWVNSDTGAVADGIGSDGSFTPTASGNYNFTAVYVESLTFEAYVRTYDGANLSESTNGGSVEIKCGNQNSTVDSNDGTHITLNAVKGSTVTYYAKAKDGYVFDGWYTDADCKTGLENSSDKYELANVETSKKLYAKFKVDTYTVEAYAQHGNNVPSGEAGKVSFDNNNEKYASKVTTTVSRNGEVTFYAKPESGYAFIGWYESKDAPNPKIAAEDCTFYAGVYSKQMTIPYSADVKTYALYARFKALCTVEVKAMYNNENVDEAGTVKVADKEAGKISSKPVMEGDNVTVEAIVKSGYKFAGWYEDVACNKPYFKENNEESSKTFNVSNGITLYAKFELNTGVTFYLNDGGLWSGDKAKLAAYVWDDNGNKKWLEVSKTDYDNYYSFALDNNQWKQVIFVRYDPSKNLNDFPEEGWNGYVWNKTSDITIDYNNNCYVITSSPNSGGSSTGYWMTYVPGQNVIREIYVYTGDCTWFNGDDAVLAYKFSDSDSYKSDYSEVVKDGKTYYKLSVPIDKGKIYLSRAVSGSYYNGFDTTIDNTKNLFKVNGNFNGGSWETY